jgi:hypothetical protein
MASPMELYCSRDLALRLGAIEPQNVLHHRVLNASGDYLLMRATDTSAPLFWPWHIRPVLTARSS